MTAYLGIDVGSLTTKIVAVDDDGQVIWHSYERSGGGPIAAIQSGFKRLADELDCEVAGVGTTGSGRHLAGLMVGADVVKNEITAHATAARTLVADVGTVIDIGGQDSKIIYLNDGLSSGFNMNTVCAAGTGSFLDHQAERLNVPIEQFGDLALKSTNPVRISGRCGVFAESDLIHKQQLGHNKEDLIAGLCIALARNYVANVARNKPITSPVLFQGGVAANKGIRAALEMILEVELTVPPYFQVMGALGAASLAKRAGRRNDQTRFRGIDRVAGFSCKPRGFVCSDCGNLCEVNELKVDSELVSRWGSRCGKWEDLGRSSAGYGEAVEQALRLCTEKTQIRGVS